MVINHMLFQYMLITVTGMGCFWGAEKVYWQEKGVFSTQVNTFTYTDHITMTYTHTYIYTYPNLTNNCSICSSINNRLATVEELRQTQRIKRSAQAIPDTPKSSASSSSLRQHTTTFWISFGTATTRRRAWNRARTSGLSTGPSSTTVTTSRGWRRSSRSRHFRRNSTSAPVGESPRTYTRWQSSTMQRTTISNISVKTLRKFAKWLLLESRVQGEPRKLLDPVTLKLNKTSHEHFHDFKN